MTNFYPPGLEYEKQNLAIDFDGVIHNAYKGWGDGTCYGEPLPGALEAVKSLSEKYNISQYVSLVTAEKPRAELYIDDNAYRFTDWNNTLKFIEKL